MKRAGDVEVQLHEFFNLWPRVGKRVASHNAHSTHTGTEIVTHGSGATEDLKVV